MKYHKNKIWERDIGMKIPGQDAKIDRFLGYQDNGYLKYLVTGKSLIMVRAPWNQSLEL